MFRKKETRGRKKLPKGQKKTYQKMAVRPHTYERIKLNAKKNGEMIVDYIERIVD